MSAVEWEPTHAQLEELARKIDLAYPDLHDHERDYLAGLIRAGIGDGLTVNYAYADPALLDDDRPAVVTRIAGVVARARTVRICGPSMLVQAWQPPEGLPRIYLATFARVESLDNANARTVEP